MPGTKNPCITSVDSSVTCTDRPSGTAIVSGLPLVVSVAVFPLTDRPSLRYLADHCHWDPAERLVVTGSQWQWSARYLKEGLSVSGAAKNVTRGPLFPGFCTG